MVPQPSLRHTFGLTALASFAHSVPQNLLEDLEAFHSSLQFSHVLIMCILYPTRESKSIE